MESARAFGGRRAHDLHTAAQLRRKHVEERFRRRARAEAKFHTVLDEFERPQCGGAFEAGGIGRVGHGKNVA